MSVSICTVVSFDGSSSSGYKIAMQLTDGSKVTLTVLAVITKAGATYIPSQRLSEMFEISGLQVTEVNKMIGEPMTDDEKFTNGVTLTLPWPPSMNTCWRTFQGRMIISAKGREYRKAVIEQVKEQGGNKSYQGKLCVEIEAFRPDKRKRDLDNLLKAVLDGCTHAGVWEDDSNIVDLRIYWADTIGGMIKVNVREL